MVPGRLASFCTSILFTVFVIPLTVCTFKTVNPSGLAIWMTTPSSDPFILTISFTLIGDRPDILPLKCSQKNNVRLAVPSLCFFWSYFFYFYVRNISVVILNVACNVYVYFYA